MNNFSPKVIIFFILLIIINIFLSAYWLLQGDIHYDVDVSRDFLVMYDIVKNLHFTLLGPRSGAIPGVFHGPLWFYVNLPAFIIGGGNPLAVGWFWFVLSVILLWIIFWVAKKMFGFEVAILSVLLFSVNSIINPSIGLKNFYNPYGAVFLTPLLFWWFYQYITSFKAKYLIMSLFVLGLIIQFQMAFGIPILILITVYLVPQFLRKRKVLHFLSYFILLIPLSTFIMFDLKHNGLQLNAFLQFLNYQNNSSSNLINIFNDRIKSLFFDFFDFLSPGKNILTILYAIFFSTIFAFVLTNKNYGQRKIYQLFALLFFGFWVISLFYQGGIGNYFWPFLPLTIIIYCSFYNFLKRSVFIVIFSVLYLINLYIGISAIAEFKTDINKRGPHSWAFNYYVAQQIYKDAGGNFGYFNFSPDRFAYQQRYAMAYTQKEFPKISAFSSTKMPNTYLLEVDPPMDRPELNGISWRISDVGIDRSPDQTFRFDFIYVEKYLLDNNELKAKSNPYLLDNMFIR